MTRQHEYEEIIEESQKRIYPIEVLWDTGKEGVRIHRIFGLNLEVTVPAKIEGMPVTEIGPYCFSASERYKKEGCFVTSLGEKEERMVEPTMPEISGKYVEGVYLPDSIHRIDNAAFYNCRQLRYISFGKEVDVIGSDVFMNCNHLKRVIIRGNCEERTGLPIILERIKSELEVCFEPQKGQYEAVLLFPEYYEWLNEITAAHIFNRSIEGEGLRMRQCFLGRKIDFAKYDQNFSNVEKAEEDSIVSQLAMDRLRWPEKLSEDIRIVYKNAVEQRYTSVIKKIVKERDIKALSFLCEYFQPDNEKITSFMNTCIKEEWTEGNVFLMEKKQKETAFAEKSYEFDDFEDDW